MKVQIAKRGGDFHVTLAGNLDEAAEAALTAAAPKLAKAHVVFDLAGVTRINSFGYRNWLEFLKAVRKSSSFDFVNCPPVFVEYCNLLPLTSFAEAVRTISLPYQCRSCGERGAPRYDVADLDRSKPFDVLICPECNGSMTADVPPDEFLAFLGGDQDD